VKQQRETVQQLDQRVHNDQVTRRELEVRCDGVRERAAEQLSLDIDEAYADYESREIDWEATATEIDELKKKLDKLGNVNLEAIDEQTELEQREQELGGQIEDLDTARKELEQLIGRLDEESRTRSASTSPGRTGCSASSSAGAGRISCSPRTRTGRPTGWNRASTSSPSRRARSRSRSGCSPAGSGRWWRWRC
jgi:hypothetical protein